MGKRGIVTVRSRYTYRCIPHALSLPAPSLPPSPPLCPPPSPNAPAPHLHPKPHHNPLTASSHTYTTVATQTSHDTQHVQHGVPGDHHPPTFPHGGHQSLEQQDEHWGQPDGQHQVGVHRGVRDCLQMRQQTALGGGDEGERKWQGFSDAYKRYPA